MVYGTVCSGVEAFGPAWEAMGYACAFHAEIAPHPSAVLRYHYPDVPNYGDFSQVQSSDATAIDVLCGGTPCQDFSVAGLRKGLAGDRGNLTLEFARLAQRLRPRWLVYENVPGMLSADAGRAFGQFLALLAECGYYAAYRVFDAQYFGVAQRRERVFLIGYLGDWRPAAAVLFESESLRGGAAPSRQAWEEIAGTCTATTSGSGPASRLELCISGHLQVVGTLTTGCSTGSGWRIGPDEVIANHAICITGNVSHTLTAIGFDASEDGTGRGSPIVVEPDRSIRRLTPIEWERLMGYPDNWTQYGTYPNGQTKQIADGPRYQMCGNGWATPVANWIGQRIMLVNNLLKAA